MATTQAWQGEMPLLAGVSGSPQHPEVWLLESLVTFGLRLIRRGSLNWFMGKNAQRLLAADGEVLTLITTRHSPGTTEGSSNGTKSIALIASEGWLREAKNEFRLF